MRRLFAILLAVICQGAHAFDETYYVRDDDGGPYGNQSGVGWANAFAGWQAIAFGTGAGQAGPGDLICVDGDVASISDNNIAQGGTSAIAPLTVAGAGYSSCNDASDSGSGKLRKQDFSGTGVLFIQSTAQWVTVRDITVEGFGTGTVGADGIRVGAQGVSQNGIQIGPGVIIIKASDEGIDFNSNTPGGIEIDCDPVFGQIDHLSCAFSLQVDTTRSDGISCRTPQVIARKFQVFNSGRNTGGNNDGLAMYDSGNNGSDCWAFDWRFFWVSNHGGTTVNAGSAAIDIQVNGIPPQGMEISYLQSGLVTGSIRCLKNLAAPQQSTRVSGVILQACRPSIHVYYNGVLDLWNTTVYGGITNYNHSGSQNSCVGPSCRNVANHNSIYWPRDADINNVATPFVSLWILGTAPFLYTFDYNVVRTGTMFGYTNDVNNFCKNSNACPLADWESINPGKGSPWDQNSQETSVYPFIGPLPSVNEPDTSTDLLTPVSANTGARLAAAHVTRTAGTAPPAWARDFCGNTYVDAGGGDYAVGAFEPSNTSCDVWTGVSGPAPPPAPNKRSFGGSPATGGIW